MNNGTKELSLRDPYLGAVRWVSLLTIFFALLAIALSLYVDSFGRPGGAVEGSIGVLWHCVTLSFGGLVGLLTGPRLATVSQS